MSESQPADGIPDEASSTRPDGQALIEAIRAILVGQERQHLGQLEAELHALEQRLQANEETVLERLQALLVDVQRLEAKTEPDSLAEKLHPVMAGLVRQTIQDSPEEMAEAIGPVMGEAIRVRIRDSRKDMVEAISPIIGKTIQKAISDFARELQRNVDARLKSTFGPAGLLRRLGARLRGVSAAELAIRDALPFSVEEIFLIHRESGLLLTHLHPSREPISNPDLISSMLTAIRDFMKDSFGHGQEDKELDEIQYGEQRIIIQGGRFAYLAVVITGIEPSGFRARMRELVSDLHLKYGNALQAYAGDSTELPDFASTLGNLLQRPEGGVSAAAPTKMSRNQRLLIIGSLLAILVLLAACCFYVRFTYALLPVAFPPPTATSTNTLTHTPTATSTNAPTNTPTGTPTATATATLVLPSPTPTMTFMATPITAVALGDVWLRAGPNEETRWLGVVRQGTSVHVLSAYGKYWLEVEWVSEDGTHQDGWVGARWMFLLMPLPASYITPAAMP